VCFRAAGAARHRAALLVPIPPHVRDTSELAGTLTTLFSELVDGAPQGRAYMLNQGDAGLLRSLDRLSASASTHGGATIAAEARRRMRDFLTEGDRNQKKAS
jgi:hypothetical protein